MDQEYLVLRPIDEVDGQVLEVFCCGVASLNDFLRNEAIDYNLHGITQTTVVFHVDNAELPIAYFSLSADAIALNTMERGDLGLPFKTEISFFPAVKITKFAVHKEWHGQGIGKSLMEMIQGMMHAQHMAVRLLNVNALAEATPFYERLGFFENLDARDKRARQQHPRRRRGNAEPKAEQETVLMHLDIYAD